MLIKLLDWGTWLVPLLLSLMCYSIAKYYKLLKPYQKVIYIFLLISLSVDLLSRFWSFAFAQNLEFISIFAIIEVIIFYIFYYKILSSTNHLLGNILTIFALAYLCLDMLLFQTNRLTDYQTYTRSVSSLYIVVSSLLYYKKIYSEYTRDKELLQLNGILLLYYSLNFILYLPINYIINVSVAINISLWIFKIILLLIFYLYLWKHLMNYGKNKKQSRIGF
ncbi:membrane hypothetical protein [Sphingobacterium sp. PM2-P1-29]|nr:membrane hypothetical protein [Sphingobacterium sp. PM2-P1-29]